MKKSSLSSYLVKRTVLYFSILVLFTAFITSVAINRKNLSSTNNALIAEKNKIQGNFEVYQECLEIFLKTFSSLPEEELQDRDKMSRFLVDLCSTRDEFKDAYFAYPDGSAVFASGWQPPEGYDARTRGWYQEAIKDNGKVTYVKPYFELEANQLVVAVCGAKIENGEVKYVSAIEISLENIVKIVKEISVEKGSYAFILSKDGDVYYHPNPVYAPENGEFKKIDKSIEKLVAYGQSPTNPPILNFGADKKLKYFYAQGIEDMDDVICVSVPVLQANRAIIFQVVLMVILSAIFILLSVKGTNKYINQAIVKPIGKIGEVANEIALGNSDVNIIIDRQDEIGHLQRSFSEMTESIKEQISCVTEIAKGDLTVHVKNRSEKDKMNIALNEMLDNLKDMFKEINSSSNQVSSAATQISAGSTMLAEGSTEQTASIEGILNEINAIAEKTKENSDSTNKAYELIGRVKNNAEEGSIKMSELMQAVKEINDASENIDKVNKVIEDIAFQTNILALNAAVEAARAGEHGKGFSVVAAEVRNLAQKSGLAAKDTSEMIANSIEKARVGVDIAVKTSEMLSEISTGVNDATEVLSEIAASSEEQNKAISEVDSNIAQVSKVVQSTSATAEESAASAQEMNRLAETLLDLVSRFKVK